MTSYRFTKDTADTNAMHICTNEPLSLVSLCNVDCENRHDPIPLPINLCEPCILAWNRMHATERPGTDTISL